MGLLKKLDGWKEDEKYRKGGKLKNEIESIQTVIECNWKIMLKTKVSRILWETSY